MHFLDLHIDGFGKFHNFDLSLAEGMNVIYGNNETGKSTIYTFIRAMLFGFTRVRGVEAEHSLMRRYTPWENPEIYGGRLRLTDGRCIYRIERDFYKDKNDFTLYNETEEKAEEEPARKLSALLGGLTETAYDSTVSVGQLKSRNSEGMHEELSRAIRNMNTTGDMSLDVGAALKELDRKKELLEAHLYPETAREYASVVSQMQKLEKELKSPALDNRMPADREMPQPEINADRKTPPEQALESSITRARTTLGEKGFTDTESVDQAKSEADRLYAEWKKKKDSFRPQMHNAAGLIFLAFAAICAGVSFLKFHLPVVFVMFFLILAIVYLIQGQWEKRTLARAEQEARAIFERYTGEKTVSEEAKAAFDQKMAKYRELAEKLTQLEASKLTGEEKTAVSAAPAPKEQMEQKWNAQWAVDQKLEELSELRGRAAELKSIVGDNRKIREDIEAIDLAEETLKELSRTMKSSFGYYLNQAASDTIRVLTNGRYSSLDVDNDMRITLNQNGRQVPIEQTSGGTAEQIWLALRLAAARIMPKNGIILPLIFDESFALYDRKRLADALTLLAGTEGGGRQVLIFTCGTEEIETLESENIRFHKIRLS